ncbi:MAG: hypothetical protein M3Y87_20030 [Myxococcota bacterium]|nr:hypothetical protein [Myxococcota bacterium]
MNGIALRLGLACAVLLGLAACGEPEPIITIRDSGVTDSGTTTGTDSGTTTRTDSGTPDTCPPGTAAAPMPATHMTCSMETRMCIAMATSQAAYDACIAADATNGMACGSCLNAELLNTCSATGICDEQFGEIICCLMAECGSIPAGPDQQACINMELGAGGSCAAQGGAFQSCVNTAVMAMECGNTTLCDMPAATTFAPVFTPRPMSYFVPSLLEALRASSLR